MNQCGGVVRSHQFQCVEAWISGLESRSSAEHYLKLHFESARPLIIFPLTYDLVSNSRNRVADWRSSAIEITSQPQLSHMICTPWPLEKHTLHRGNFRIHPSSRCHRLSIVTLYLQRIGHTIYSSAELLRYLPTSPSSYTKSSAANNYGFRFI